MRAQLLTFMAAAAASALLTNAPSASAWFMRSPAMNCERANFGTMTVGTLGITNTHTTETLSAVCPILDLDDHDRNTIQTLNVHVFDGNSDFSHGVAATPCVGFFATIGGSCGNGDTTNNISQTFTGQDTLSIGANARTFYQSRPGDFAVVLLSVTDTGADPSRVSGYFVSN